jgi:hypothetical protein
MKIKTQLVENWVAETKKKTRMMTPEGSGYTHSTSQHGNNGSKAWEGKEVARDGPYKNSWEIKQVFVDTMHPDHGPSPSVY